MNIKKYILKIIKKIKWLEIYIKKPIENKDIVNPFLRRIPKTYVWIDEEINR